MKFEWNKKYTVITIYACIVAALTVGLIFAGINFPVFSDIVSKFLKLSSPLIYGFVIAYLMNPILKFFENKVFVFKATGKSRKKLKRILSLVITYIIYAIVLVILFSLIIPQVVISYNDLMSKMDLYVSSAQKWVENLAESSAFLSMQYNRLLEYIDINKITGIINDLIADSYDIIKNITPYILEFMKIIADQLKNAFFGLVFSVYFLLAKEKLAAQLKKTLYAFFSHSNAVKTIELARYTDKTFGRFIVGKLLDSLIMGILSFIVLAAARMPYYQLIAVIIGVTNVIPFFGPIIGAIPGTFIIFIAEPVKAIWFLIIVIILQQIDGNYIGPKILGDSTGLSALWVIIAITIMSGIMGILGMFIGVPTFAVIYYLIRNFVAGRLKKKNMPCNTSDYMGDVPNNADCTDEKSTGSGGDDK